MNRLPVLLALPLVFALGCAKPWPQRAPLDVSPVEASAGQSRLIDHAVLILDASMTMSLEATFPEAKALTESLIAAMPDVNSPGRNSPSYEAGLIVFGGRQRAGAPLAPFDRGALGAEAERVEPLGRMTPLHAALQEAADALSGKAGRAAVVIFSDGLPDVEERALEAGRRLAAAYDGEVCIHAVHMGADPAGAAFLARLAGQSSCGSVREGSAIYAADTLREFSRDVFLREGLPQVAAGPCAGRIVLRGVQFAFDSDDLTPESTAVLDAGIEELARCPELSVDIAGHTCSVGPEDYNLGLSERRANAVVGYLSANGIGRARLTAQGFGEAQPVADNASRDGRAQNRRVELTPNR